MSKLQQTTIRRQTRRQTRRWLRIDEPREGYWPWGIAPIAGFLAIFFISVCHVAPHRIENDIERTVRGQLERAGYSWTNVEADGQEVLVTGAAPGPLSELLLTSLARATECDTMLGGELVCPTRVRVLIDQAQLDQAQLDQAQLDQAQLDQAQLDRDQPDRAQEPDEPAAPAQRFHNVSLSAEGDRVVLAGEVPSQAQRGEVLAMARAHFSDVVDQLTVSNGVATPSYAHAWAHALAILAKLESGQAAWSNGTLTLDGFVLAANAAEVRRQFAAPDPAVPLGPFDIIINEEADSCDSEFAAALSDSTIRFATGSTLIEDSSQRLLATLAEVAKRCPGTLAIEGHTDNVGAPESNQILSQGRADAVVDALGGLGVDTGRLAPKGFGQSRPVAANTSEAGRARNRRIEIRIKR